jgi:hypothetical protein
VFRRATLAAATVAFAVLPTLPAAGDDDCTLTPTGVECNFEGTTTSIVTVTSIVPEEAPPLRYLRVLDDECWYWTRYPPGIDSWSSANDTVIVMTLWRLDECRGEASEPHRWTTSEVIRRAWDIFRRFPLDPPELRIDPETGITGLPSFASTPIPAPLAHAETLPDGTRLAVRAQVDEVMLSWGDETPPLAVAPGALRPYPRGTATHTYLLKTCPARYRVVHPSGPNCHPTLSAYEVRATFVWRAWYRHGEGWVDLGVLHRSHTVSYDVDEAVGVLG